MATLHYEWEMHNNITGRVIYRYRDGLMYSGMMNNSRPHGYGVMLGELWCHEGVWENGVLIRGTMINIATGLKINIPVIPLS